MLQEKEHGVNEIEMTMEVISVLSTVIPSDSFRRSQMDLFEAIENTDDKASYYRSIVITTVEGKMGLAHHLIEKTIESVGGDAAVSETALSVVANEIESMDSLVEMVYYVIRVLTKFVRKGGTSWGQGYRGWVVKPEILSLAKRAIESWAGVCGVDIEYYSGLAKIYASK